MGWCHLGRDIKGLRVCGTALCAEHSPGAGKGNAKALRHMLGTWAGGARGQGSRAHCSVSNTAHGKNQENISLSKMDILALRSAFPRVKGEGRYGSAGQTRARQQLSAPALDCHADRSLRLIPHSSQCLSTSAICPRREDLGGPRARSLWLREAGFLGG